MVRFQIVAYQNGRQQVLPHEPAVRVDIEAVDREEILIEPIEAFALFHFIDEIVEELTFLLPLS